MIAFLWDILLCSVTETDISEKCTARIFRME
jgi:hypothetical protein